MAEFKHNPNTGSIFKNDKKGNEKAPDYKGTINVDGKDLSIALWVKEGKKGNFFSVKIEQPFKPQEKSFVKDQSDMPF